MHTKCGIDFRWEEREGDRLWMRVRLMEREEMDREGEDEGMRRGEKEKKEMRYIETYATT